MSFLTAALLDLIDRARARLSERDGQGMVEYAFILILVAIAVIIVLSILGKQVNNVFSNVSNGLNQ